jgi:hypothetical protein
MLVVKEKLVRWYTGNQIRQGWKLSQEKLNDDIYRPEYSLILLASILRVLLKILEKALSKETVRKSSEYWNYGFVTTTFVDFQWRHQVITVTGTFTWFPIVNFILNRNFRMKFIVLNK